MVHRYTKDRFDDRLSLAQMMEASGKLSVALAHDVGNMLTPIRAYCQLIANALPTQSPLRSYLKEIQEAAEAVADLTSEMMRLSCDQLPGLSLISLNDLILDADKLIRKIIGQEIELVTRLAPEAVTVRMNRRQLWQVLLNLVFNARDAMANGGTLTIRTANVPSDDEYVKRHLRSAAGPQVVLVVGDTGTGMTNEVKEHIFETFFTTKELGKGTGLGLAMCFSVVSLAGGHITADSEPGRGSWFRVYLPKAEDLGMNGSPPQSKA